MRGERLGVVALEEAEVVELVADGAAEERTRRDAQRPAERVPAGDLDPGEDDLRELRPHLPAALPRSAQDRLHVAGVVADDLPRHQLAVRDDRARVLADRLAVADDAVVGVHGEEDDVRAELRAARPVELLASGIASGVASTRAIFTGAPSVRRSRPSFRRARAPQRCRARAARSRAPPRAPRRHRRPRRSRRRPRRRRPGRPGRTATPSSVTGTRSAPGAVLAGPARRGADVEDGHADATRVSARSRMGAVDDDSRDAPLACGEREDVPAMGGSASRRRPRARSRRQAWPAATA